MMRSCTVISFAARREPGGGPEFFRQAVSANSSRPINMRRSKEPSRLEQQFAHPDRLAGEVVDRTEEERAKQAFSLLV